MDANVTSVLVSLLDDVDVCESAVGALCNIVLDFSPQKQQVVDGGGLEKLVSLAQGYLPVHPTL